jgi:hypothetical protein
MKLTYQSYGSSIQLYIEGTPAEAYGKYLSLFNWGATSTGKDGSSWEFNQVAWVKDGVIAVWTTMERLKEYLFNLHTTRLTKGNTNHLKGQKDGVKDAARAAAEADFAAIQHETYRSVNGSFVEHEFGTIVAEKPDLDLKDYFITKGLQGA